MESQTTKPLLADEAGKNADEDTLLSSSTTSTQSAERDSRPSVQECLGVPEKDMANIERDVYNMFYISDLWSLPFFYSILVLATKMALYIILAVDLVLDDGSYPFERKKEGMNVKLIVKLAQLFLIPVAIVIQEELMVTFFVFGNLKYSPGILKRHPSAYRWKWYVAHSARALDGIMFLYINTSLMLQVVNMLAMFLNFAALMFLQTIDNVALQVCVDGYWSRSLQECAQDVEEMKFAFRRKSRIGCLEGRTTILWVSAAYAILVGFWVKVHFFDP